MGMTLWSYTTLTDIANQNTNGLLRQYFPNSPKGTEVSVAHCRRSPTSRPAPEHSPWERPGWRTRREGLRDYVAMTA